MSTATKVILVVLGLPKPVAALIIRINAIIEAMIANKSVFPTPPLALGNVTAHVATLSSAETATKAKTVGTYQARDAAKQQVIADAGQLHAYVQQLCNASPAQAETIAAAAAMTLRKSGARQKSDLSVAQSVSGAVKVVAYAGKGSLSHEWEYSADGGKTWQVAPPTAQARTVITGITPGSTVQFRHRSVTRSGATDWSAPVTMAVS